MLSSGVLVLVTVPFCLLDGVPPGFGISVLGCMGKTHFLSQNGRRAPTFGFSTYVSAFRNSSSTESWFGILLGPFPSLLRWRNSSLRRLVVCHSLLYFFRGVTRCLGQLAVCHWKESSFSEVTRCLGSL